MDDFFDHDPPPPPTWKIIAWILLGIGLMFGALLKLTGIL
jgi:hypothetical protein